MPFQPTWRLRARFAAALSQMYGQEVPAYTTLVDVANEINAEIAGANSDFGRLGGIDRITAERHGAIRVGTPAELLQVSRIFRAFGMYPVDFYDLRDTSGVPIPVVSTAFRPIDGAELERNPFRVFTSMLAVDDNRFFRAGLRDRLRAFLDERTLFDAELLRLSARAADGGGLSAPEAEQLIELATAAFELSREPTDRAWYSELEQVSAVAADIGGVTRTHINHLTPRVLDIDELYVRMKLRGLEMIDRIQGPPRWNGPDVLLRQTSFRALAEPRLFSGPDGSVTEGTTRVRFGEVEQRGIALTPLGRARYSELMAETERELQSGSTELEAGRMIWNRSDFPADETQMRRRGFGYFTYRVTTDAPIPHISPEADLDTFVSAGIIIATPIVYEDFLPRSAAGIFQSNLTGGTGKDNRGTAALYDIDWLANTLGCKVHESEDLYATQSRRSLAACCVTLGLESDRFIADPPNAADVSHSDVHNQETRHVH
jgi:uncharacterized glyoxalase superfamily metalloenzyme YdcJ